MLEKLQINVESRAHLPSLRSSQVKRRKHAPNLILPSGVAMEAVLTKRRKVTPQVIDTRVAKLTIVA
jgi:hypothetical protein